MEEHKLGYCPKCGEDLTGTDGHEMHVADEELLITWQMGCTSCGWTGNEVWIAKFYCYEDNPV